MAGTGTFGLGWVWFVAAGQARTGKVCCGLVRPGWVRQGRCVVVRCGLLWQRQAWRGSSRQAGLGADRCVLVGCGELRQVRHGAASSRKVRLVPVRQVRRDKVGHGEVRQV